MPGVPTNPGYYWAKWRIADKGTDPGIARILPMKTWEIVQVWFDAFQFDTDGNKESFRVDVMGIAASQSIDNFFWGNNPTPLTAPPNANPDIDPDATSQRLFIRYRNMSEQEREKRLLSYRKKMGNN